MCLRSAQSHCASIVADSAEATGLKWAAPAGGGGSMTLLSTTSVGFNSTITISSINQSYKHLFVELDGAAGAADGIGFQVNSAVNCWAGTTREYTQSGATSGAINNYVAMVFNNSPVSTNKAQNYGWITFYDYANSVHFKTFDTLSFYNQNESIRKGTQNAGFFATTDAITSITARGNGGTPLDGGTIRIYGVN